jgi:hypothetical protein
VLKIGYSRFQADMPIELQSRVKAALRCIPRPEGGGRQPTLFVEFAIEERLGRMAERYNDGEAWVVDPSPPPLVVYFCRDPHRGNIKIGKSTNLEKRMVDLRCAVPDLELLCWVPDAEPELEADLHKRWKDFAAGGEWFTLEGVADYAEWVDEHCTFPTDTEAE